VAAPVPVQDGLRRVVRAGGHRRSEPGEDIEAGELLLAAGHWLRPADLAAIADGTLLAAPHRHGAGTISRLMRASAWWPIPIGQGHFAAGEHIGVYPLPGAPA